MNRDSDSPRLPARIAVDAMGGDHAPEAVVEGTVAARRRWPDLIRPILVGDEGILKAELIRLDARDLEIEVVHAGQRVEMSESGAESFRKKRDSSLAVATRLVRDGAAQGVFSAGNTGAMVAASLLNMGRVPGVNRPAIATLFPVSSPPYWAVMLDVGATADCKPINLYQYGVLGDIYARLALGVERPRVGLLNIGEESTKGNELAQEAHALLANGTMNFVGNVEGRDILEGKAHVVVTDGFTGNIMLKFAESVWSWVTGLVREEIGEHVLAKFGAVLLRPSLRRIKHRMDYSEVGGAPLLGVDGVCIIGHGRSDATAVANGVRVAAELVEKGLTQEIRRELSREEGGEVVYS